MDETTKQEAIELAHEADNMNDPRIIISPIFPTTVDEWKRILAAFIELKTAISEKTNSPIVLSLIDAYNDINESLLHIDIAEGISRADDENDEADGFPVT